MGQGVGPALSGVLNNRAQAETFSNNSLSYALAPMMGDSAHGRDLRPILSKANKLVSHSFPPQHLHLFFSFCRIINNRQQRNFWLSGAVSILVDWGLSLLRLAYDHFTPWPSRSCPRCCRIQSRNSPRVTIPVGGTGRQS